MDLYLAVLEIVRFPLKLHINLPVSSCGVHVCLMLWCHAWLSQTKVCTLLSLTEEYASARYFHYTIQSEVNMVWEYCDYHWKNAVRWFSRILHLWSDICNNCKQYVEHFVQESVLTKIDLSEFKLIIAIYSVRMSTLEWSPQKVKCTN